MNIQMPKSSRRVRFEEVTPAHEYAAFFNVSIAPLVAHLRLPIFDGYDDLDDLQLAFLTLPSGETVTLGEYAGAPGTSLYVDMAMQNIPQIIFDSCQQLRVSRPEIEWVHADWQVEFDKLYAKHGEIEGIERKSTVEESSQSNDYEPIDCFYHALEIYTREKLPEYWAMLQHNLGLAYQHRNQGDRIENLENSIECFKKSLTIYTLNKFPAKWKLNQDDLKESWRLLYLFYSLNKHSLVKDIVDRQIKNRVLRRVDLNGTNLSFTDLSGANLFGANLTNANLDGVKLSFAKLSFVRLISANLSGTNLTNADLFGADVSCANLRGANLNGANLSDANPCFTDLTGADLSDANLRFTDLTGADLSNADVKNTRFGFNLGISEYMKQDLIERGAIFEDSPGDRSEDRTLVPR